MLPGDGSSAATAAAAKYATQTSASGSGRPMACRTVVRATVCSKGPAAAPAHSMAARRGFRIVRRASASCRRTADAIALPRPVVNANVTAAMTTRTAAETARTSALPSVRPRNGSRSGASRQKPASTIR